MKKNTFLPVTKFGIFIPKENNSEQSPSIILPLGRKSYTISSTVFQLIQLTRISQRSVLGSRNSLYVPYSMFHVLTFAFFSLLTSHLFSQGNLQFNQVLTISSTDLTVPAGKVWKVESYQQQQATYTFNNAISNCTDLSRPRPYYINNIAYYRLNIAGTGLANVPVSPVNEFPIWLKTGQTLRTSCSGDFLSVIEFNVIP